MALSKINTMNHSHWITAVIGLHYLEEGLQYFCDDVVKELHATIMARCPENCTECKLETLQPNHICEDKRCPLGYQNCNCRKTNVALIPCPKRICGFIYDEIIKLYASTPPAPNWKNTDINQWCTNPWAVATCFIPITGYLDRKCGAEVDCAGLLLLIMKNQAFLKHLDCKIDGKDAFSQAVQIRNGLFHSSSLELMREEAHRYIDDMIKVLQDQSELVKRHESKKAVKKLIELKEGDIPSELDMDKLNNLIETDEQGLIQYLRDKLNSLWSETLNQNFRIQDPGFTQRRKLDTSVAEQEDKGKLFEYFLKVKSVFFEVEAIDSIDEHTEKSIAKYSEDQTQALRIHVVQVEILDLEIKKLKQADDRKVDNRNETMLLKRMRSTAGQMSSDDAVEYAPSTSCVLESSARKGNKAINALFNVTRGTNVPIYIMFNSLDAYVLSVLNYRSEVWGFVKAENVERVHTTFFKWINQYSISISRVCHISFE